MPYFTRRAYAEMRPPAAPPEEDIVALAAATLARETGAAAEEGPFRIRAPIRAGGRGEMTLSVTAADGGPVSGRLVASDLTGPGGSIPAARVTLDPPTLAGSRGDGAVVRVTVAPAAGTPPGLYRGGLTTEGGDGPSIAIEAVVAG